MQVSDASNFLDLRKRNTQLLVCKYRKGIVPYVRLNFTCNQKEKARIG